MIREMAASIACELISYPQNEQYTNEDIRQFQGCPTLAISKNGRIFVGWYSGGIREPDIENFNLLIYSDDDGKTWSKPILVIPSSKERYVQALDIQLFTAPDGRLFIYWIQNNVKPANVMGKDGKPLYTGTTVFDDYIYDDHVHAMWMCICENPDADHLTFSSPRCVDKGFLRCKPLVMRDGRWLLFNYDQASTHYGYRLSADHGETYTHFYGAGKIPTPFDEGMAYETKNGDIRMLARTGNTGRLAESVSHDLACSWEEAKNSEIVSPSSRFYISKTPSGRILLIHNNHPTLRTNMTIALSDDDGQTFPHFVTLDTRNQLSYPDADFKDGKIYLTYNCDRCGEKEILFAVFTEEDVINHRTIPVFIISKPKN